MDEDQYRNECFSLIEWLATNDIHLIISQMNEVVVNEYVNMTISYYVVLNKNNKNYGGYCRLNNWQEVYAYLQGYMQYAHESSSIIKK